MPQIISRFQRSEPLAGPPGPLAQAITFRAVGAETLGFHRGSKSRNCPFRSSFFCRWNAWE
jgi:hypothetical protein